METTPEGYAWDCLAGPIYSYRGLSVEDAVGLRRLPEGCQIITVLVIRDDEHAELRHYFTLTLDEALVRAVEIQVRLTSLCLHCRVIQIEPAKPADTEAFFAALHDLEARMPAPVQTAAIDERTRTRAVNSDGAPMGREIAPKAGCDSVKEQRSRP